MKKYIPILVVTLILGLVLFGPWEVSYGFRTAARVQPVESWVLTHQPNGLLQARWHDHREGGVRDEQMFQFDRGDIWEINYLVDTLTGKWVSAGQEVVRVRSNRLDEQLLTVNNELTEFRALLVRDAAGRKPETIRRLQEELRLAEQTVTLREKQFNRTRDMLSEGLSAVADFERAENTLRESRLAVEVARKRLEEEMVGEKPEQLDWLRTQIGLLENTRNFLERKDSLYGIYCPINGTWSVKQLVDGTEEFRVTDTVASVITFPVRERDLDFLADSLKLVLMDGNQRTFDLNEWSFTGERSILNNEPVRWVQAIIPGLRNAWSDGIPVPCRIEAGRVRIREYLARTFRLQF